MSGSPSALIALCALLMTGCMHAFPAAQMMLLASWWPHQDAQQGYDPIFCRAWVCLTDQSGRQCSCAFCHVGWEHLSNNLFLLFVFGRIVEEEEGAAGVWVSYLLSAVGMLIRAQSIALQYVYDQFARSALVVCDACLEQLA